MRLEVISHVPQTPTYKTPILFLHGAWHGAWCWEDNFLPYFASKGYAAHAMSLRAHGGSEGRERLRWTSIGDYVTDLLTIVRAMPQPPVIAAHSLGGYVLQKYLEDYDAPAAVMIAPASSSGTWRFALGSLRRSPRSTLRALTTFTLYHMVGTPDHAHRTFFSPTVPRAEVERHHARMQDESYRALLDLTLLAPPDVRRIRARGTPMLIVSGENDRVFPPRIVEALGRLYGASVTMLPDTAHDIMLEAAWQTAADRICEWLGEQGLE